MTTGKSNIPADQLFRLREQLADDVMNTSNDEIIAEIKATGIDPNAAASHMREVVQRAILESGKNRMAAAKAQLQAQRSQTGRHAPIDIGRARKLLLAAAANDPLLNQRLTLAARNGETLSDSDIQSLVEDLIDLGILSDGKDDQ